MSNFHLFIAPISESGDITHKLMAIRETLSKYMPVPKIPMPANSTKKTYGKIQMQWVIIKLILTLEKEKIIFFYFIVFNTT